MLSPPPRVDTIGSELHLRYNGVDEYDIKVPGVKVNDIPVTGIDVVVGKVESERAEVRIEVEDEAVLGGRRRAYRARLGLLSTTSKQQAVKACKDTVGEANPSWKAIIEDVCDRALNTKRARIAPVKVGIDSPEPHAPKYQLFPLLQRDQTTLIWGASDIGKSWLAIYACALVEHGLTLSGLTADGVGQTLYVDYETSADAIGERVNAVKNGLGDLIAPDWGLDYLPATAPLADWIDDLQRHVAKEKVDLVVIDSVGLAVGGAFNEGEQVIQLFAAVRQLECTVLLVDHSGKGEDAAERGAIGSSYKRHLARSMWELRRGGADGNAFEIGLFHRKANNSRRSKPFGLKVDIETDDNEIAQLATFRRCDVADSPELVEGLSVSERITAMLKHGAMNASDIVEGMSDKAEQTVRAELARMVKKGRLVNVSRGRYGLSQ